MVKDSRIRSQGTKALLYLLYLMVSTGIAVELGARVLLSSVDDAETIQQQALARLLNSATVGGADTPLGVRLSPHAEQTVRSGDLVFTVRTNSLGFRGPDPAAPTGDEHRVLFLGDSMVFGHGLEEDETLPHQVQVSLRRAGTEASVYNGAISGLSTVQELAATAQLLPVLQPDQVVLGYFVGNDPLANLLSYVDDQGHVQFSAADVEDLRLRLHDHLRPLLPSVAFRAIALRYYVPRLRYWWSSDGSVLQRSCDLIQEMQQVCARAGTSFSVLLIYPRDGVAGGVTSMLSGSRGVGQRLASMLAELDVAVLDTARLLPTGADRRFYFATDGHLNAAGTRELAGLVAQELAAQGLAAQGLLQIQKKAPTP